ncbi:MAG: pantoate--beta-alanine ligase [Gammaproteobacteria bacterium]|nr:pantoate--beta-alanine ligase [Gammaproteobacteria bacterium]
MRIARSLVELAALRETLTADGKSLAFVPTMGNLHPGHLRLVEVARGEAPSVLVSIFVNPLQFGDGEDFDSYPRTEETDLAMLAACGADAVFLPDRDTMYPRALADTTTVEVPGLSQILCGRSRPGHFRGVATVVARLFGLVQPQLAVFGKKDYQQLAVIRRMVADLAMPVTVLGVDTVREADGLAMSSRNGYLGPAERAQAPALYATLEALAARLRAAGSIATAGPALAEAGAQLATAGFEPDYLELRRRADLAEPGPGDRELVILAAARLGPARLIDNLEVTLAG